MNVVEQRLRSPFDVPIDGIVEREPIRLKVPLTPHDLGTVGGRMKGDQDQEDLGKVGIRRVTADDESE